MRHSTIVGALVVLGASVGAVALRGGLPAAQAQRLLAQARDSRVSGRAAGEVVVNSQVAFRILAAAGGRSAAERADVVADRLNTLDGKKALRPSELRVSRLNGAYSVMARETSLVTVTAEDARTARMSAADTASEWLTGLSDALGTAGESAKSAAPDDEKPAKTSRADEDYYPELKKKIVPILTFGSSINIGAAQVQGAERDVDQVKAVAQLEQDYKDVARIKVLVPVKSENVIKNIDRVPGVSVSAIADFAVKK